MKKPAVNSKALRQGGYLAAVTAAVVALVVLVNLVMGQLPSNVTEFDLTDNSLYEIITEELTNFFAGKKDAKTTVDVIQNRAQTYINETR